MRLGSLRPVQVCDFAQAWHHFGHMRFVDCKGAPRQTEKERGGGHQQPDPAGKAARDLIVKMGEVCDLRGFVVDGGLPGRTAALKEIHAAASRSGALLAPLPTLEAQLALAYAKLQKRAREEPFCLRDVRKADGSVSDRGGWFDPEGKPKSGVVIRKALFTDPDLSGGIGSFLHFYSHCVLKSKNEAVIEGMGSVLAVHAVGGRHLDNERYPRSETFLAYNGPPLHLADSLVEKALDMRFPKERFREGWHFDYTERSAASNSGRARGGLRHFFTVGGSDVLERLKNMKAKLSFTI